jgi:hypothetical protein
MPTLLPQPWPSGPVVVSTPAVFRMARRHAVDLTKVLDVVEADGRPALRTPLAVDRLDARQVQQAIEQHRRMAGRKHEPVAIEPGRILGVITQEAGPQRVADRSQAHGRAGVAGLRLLDRIDRQGADRVDRQLSDIDTGRNAIRCATHTGLQAQGLRRGTPAGRLARRTWNSCDDRPNFPETALRMQAAGATAGRPLGSETPALNRRRLRPSAAVLGLSAGPATVYRVIFREI